ncbi:MAG: hypothetical protein ACRD0W_19400 [Acidimicrobiales bacterium]
MTNETVATLTTSLEDASRDGQFGGEVVGPEHAEYDRARAVYNAMIDRQPTQLGPWHHLRRLRIHERVRGTDARMASSLS